LSRAHWSCETERAKAKEPFTAQVSRTIAPQAARLLKIFLYRFCTDTLLLTLLTTSATFCFQGIVSPAPPFPSSGSDTEKILWQPVMMPSGDLYPGIDYWMPH
jgi:hypothetical protein